MKWLILTSHIIKKLNNDKEQIENYPGNTTVMESLFNEL